MAAPAAAVQTLEEHYEVLQVLGKGASGVYVLMIATLQAVSQHLQRCIENCLA
jgi:UV DNA damage repair endonuclease